MIIPLSCDQADRGYPHLYHISGQGELLAGVREGDRRLYHVGSVLAVWGVILVSSPYATYLGSCSATQPSQSNTIIT